MPSIFFESTILLLACFQLYFYIGTKIHRIFKAAACLSLNVKRILWISNGAFTQFQCLKKKPHKGWGAEGWLIL
jgi:hypothetical protein